MEKKEKPHFKESMDKQNWLRFGCIKQSLPCQSDQMFLVVSPSVFYQYHEMARKIIITLKNLLIRYLG